MYGEFEKGAYKEYPLLRGRCGCGGQMIGTRVDEARCVSCGKTYLFIVGRGVLEFAIPEDSHI